MSETKTARVLPDNWPRLLAIGAFVVVAIIVLGRPPASAPGTTTPKTPNAPNAPARSAQTITGSGISKSAPFTLSGDYEVRWTATPTSDSGCYHGASLERADGEFMNETLANEILDNRTPQSGATRLYGMDDARYYVDASSGCKWSFTFSPT